LFFHFGKCSNGSACYSRGKFTGAIKIAAVGVLAGLIVGAVGSFILAAGTPSPVDPKVSTSADATKALSENLFFNHVFGFEALGVLLLVIAVGTVALSRSKGGTHAKH
jgi:NADH-quinone oxidoreductase subunit J